MSISCFEDISMGIKGIASNLICISFAMKGEDRPTDEIISDAAYNLSTQAYDLEDALDRLISENLMEQRKLKEAAVQQPTHFETINEMISTEGGQER